MTQTAPQETKRNKTIANLLGRVLERVTSDVGAPRQFLHSLTHQGCVPRDASFCLNLLYVMWCLRHDPGWTYPNWALSLRLRKNKATRGAKARSRNTRGINGVTSEKHIKYYHLKIYIS